MDVGQSFQFVVDHLPTDWTCIAPDWRGFGQTGAPAADSYWFPDYLADLDALLQHVEPSGHHYLVGHSMGGNLVMLYAGVRPDRITRLINLEGLGMPVSNPDDAPGRLARWMDSLQEPLRLRDYDSQLAVADRLRQNNPRLDPGFALYLASYWSEQTADGRYVLRADPNHKRVNPYPYRVDEVVACWSQITAPVLIAVSEFQSERLAFTREDEYKQRLARIGSLKQVQIDGAGHMVHHDQPAQVAAFIRDFMS